MTEETKEKIIEEERSVVLKQVATEYGLVFQTPDGELDQNQYLVWIGNKLVNIEKSLIG